jgi:hypothetical protein
MLKNIMRMLRRYLVMLWQQIQKTLFPNRGRSRSVSVNGRRWTYTATKPAPIHRDSPKVCLECDLVEDRIWQDLEMGMVFMRFDRSITPLGAQYLHGLLSKYEHNLELLNNNANTCRIWNANPEARQALNSVLQQMNSEESATVTNLLNDPTLKVQRLYRLFYLLSGASVVCTVGCFFSHWFLLIAVGIWAINICLNWFYGARVRMQTSGLGGLAILLSCVPKTIRALQGTTFHEIQELSALAYASRDLRRKISRIFLSRYASDYLIRIIIDYLNMFYLFELSFSCRAIVATNEQRAMCLKVHSIIGRLDAFQGISTALSEYPFFCVPELKTGRTFSVEDLYHPLVSKPVCNTVHGSGNSILLSGTNMSGKTTFMKAMAINLLFSQTIGICLARKAIMPPARLKTMIVRKDAIIGGRSHFFSEAIELRHMLQEAEQAKRDYWFIIDEIFRGTNSIERVAAGGALLNYLTRRSLVFASTHDLELSNLLRHEFDSFYFSEVIVGEDARFDYLIKKGTCQSRNAIKLMILAGYPKEVIDEANRFVAQMEK